MLVTGGAPVWGGGGITHGHKRSIGSQGGHLKKTVPMAGICRVWRIDDQHGPRAILFGGIGYLRRSNRRKTAQKDSEEQRRNDAPHAPAPIDQEA